MSRYVLIPPLIILVLLLAIFLMGRDDRGDAMDFRAGQWGELPEEIVDRESSAGFTPSEKLKEDKTFMLLFQNKSIMNYQCDIAYIFSPAASPRLVAGEYRFYDLNKSLKKQLIVTLESKYGQASEKSEQQQVYETPRSRIILDLEGSRLIHKKK